MQHMTGLGRRPIKVSLASVKRYCILIELTDDAKIYGTATKDLKKMDFNLF